jgi:hypothetical protein
MSRRKKTIVLGVYFVASLGAAIAANYALQAHNARYDLSFGWESPAPVPEGLCMTQPLNVVANADSRQGAPFSDYTSNACSTATNQPARVLDDLEPVAVAVILTAVFAVLIGRQRKNHATI